ncbi:ATP-binding cassette domain-containing protein, partial [Pseudomonas aeruginosa]
RQKGNDPRERLQELLQFFNVEDFLDRHPFDISGGELQKLAIIMVLLTDARVLLLDEPTKGLDPEMKHRLGKL